MKNMLFTVVCALGLLAVSSAHASLIMSIDTVNKSLAFTGSDTLTPGLEYVDGRGAITWQGNLTSGTDAGIYEDLTFVDVLSFSPNTVSQQKLTVIDMMGSSMLQLSMKFSNTQPVTLTGTGTWLSYASLSAGAQTLLESANGVEMSVYFGTSNTSSTISVVTVPEPGSLAMVSLGLAALALCRRKAV